MNHKGQVLVLFALLLPLVLLCIGLIVDTGLLYVEKRHIDNSVKDIVEYGLEKIDGIREIEIYDLINKNINHVIEYKIDVKDNLLYISVTTEEKSPFSFLFGKDRYKMKTSYKGVKESNNIKIVRE